MAKKKGFRREILSPAGTLYHQIPSLQLFKHVFWLPEPIAAGLPIRQNSGL